MSLTERIDVLELLLVCVREKEQRLADQVQALENVLYVRDTLKTLSVKGASS